MTDQEKIDDTNDKLQILYGSDLEDSIAALERVIEREDKFCTDTTNGEWWKALQDHRREKLKLLIECSDKLKESENKWRVKRDEIEKGINLGA